MLGPIVTAALFASPMVFAAPTDAPVVVQGLAANEIHLSDGTLVHRTALSIQDVSRVVVPGSEAVVVRWTETDGTQAVARYRVRLDGRAEFGRVREAVPTLHLQRGTFDPLQGGAPAPAAGLAESGRLYIVQYVTQSIEAYHDQSCLLGRQSNI